MRLTDEPAYVLHVRPWRETSALVEVLSRDHGRIGLVARGLNGARRHLLRAALQPLQHIRLDAVQRGELAQLRAAEAVDVAPVLVGDAMLSGFYINELLVRLAPRQDPQPELYALYGQVRARLPLAGELAWTLRRFERDLLDAIGFGFDLSTDDTGTAIDPAARYRLDPEQGARRVREERPGGSRNDSATGRALLSLAADRRPQDEDLPGLRRVLRVVIAHHLGGKGLKSWELAGELARRKRPEPQPGGDDSVS